MKPMVSVIIPTHNRAAFLKKAIDSVLGQSCRDYELVVVDDGSSDGTAELLASYGDRIISVRQENRGPSAARNLGIARARGEFIAFLDSDDWWHPDKLALQLCAMEEEPGFLISHTQEVWYTTGRLLPQKKKHRKYHGDIFDRCLPICSVSLSTVMARRELFERVGLFDESLPCCEDYDLWLRVSVTHPFLLIDEALTFKDGGRRDQLSYLYRMGMDRYRIYALNKVLGEADMLNEYQRGLAIKELKKKCRIYGNGCLKHGREEEGWYYLRLGGDMI